MEGKLVACQVCVVAFTRVSKLKSHMHSLAHRQKMMETFPQDKAWILDRGHLLPYLHITKPAVISDLTEPIIGLSFVTVCYSTEYKAKLYLCHACTQTCPERFLLSHLHSPDHQANFYNCMEPNKLSFAWIPGMDMKKALKPKAIKDAQDGGCGQLQVLTLPQHLMSSLVPKSYAEVMQTLSENDKLLAVFQGVLKNRLKIQTYLKDSNRTHPLLGTQHLVECVCAEQTEKRHYFCTLCCQTVASHVIIKHVISFDHIHAYFKAWHPRTLVSKESYNIYNAFADIILNLAKQATEIHQTADMGIKQVSVGAALFTSLSRSCYAEGLSKLESMRKGNNESSLITIVTPGEKLSLNKGESLRKENESTKVTLADQLVPRPRITSCKLSCQDCNFLFHTVGQYISHVKTWDHKMVMKNIFGPGQLGDGYERAYIPLLRLYKCITENVEPIIGVPHIVLCISTQAVVPPLNICFACEEVFSNKKVNKHFRSRKHLTLALLLQNPRRLPFAWDVQLQLQELKSLATEEQRKKNPNERVVKVFDIPYGLYPPDESHNQSMLETLRPYQHRSHRGVPWVETFGHFKHNQDFPLLGQEFIVEYNVCNQLFPFGGWAYLCLLCTRKLSEEECHAHIFSREHIVTFLKYFHPGSLDSCSGSTGTLLDLAKQAALTHPLSSAQRVIMHEPIIETCPYDQAVNLISGAKRSNGEGQLFPPIKAKKKLVPTETTKEMDKDNVTDDGQKSVGTEVTASSGECSHGNQTEKYVASEDDAVKDADKKKLAPNEKQSQKRNKAISESVSDPVMMGKKTKKPEKSCEASELVQHPDNGAEAGKGRNKRSRGVLIEKLKSSKCESSHNSCPGEDASSATDNKRQRLHEGVDAADKTTMIKGLNRIFACKCDGQQPIYFCEYCSVKITEQIIISHFHNQMILVDLVLDQDTYKYISEENCNSGMKMVRELHERPAGWRGLPPPDPPQPDSATEATSVMTSHEKFNVKATPSNTAGTCTELTAASVTAEIQKPTDTTRTSTSTSSTSTDTTAKLRETTSEAHTKTAAPTSKASSTSHKSTATTNHCPVTTTLTTATSKSPAASSKQTPEAPRCTASHTAAASKSAAVIKGLKDKQEMIPKITSESNKAAVLSHTGASLQHAASHRNASKSKEPGTASKTPTVTSAVHKTSAVSENTKGSPQTRSSEKSKASPHIHHKSNTPASASPSPSNHKASAKEAANGEMRPEKNADVAMKMGRELHERPAGMCGLPPRAPQDIKEDNLQVVDMEIDPPQPDSATEATSVMTSHEKFNVKATPSNTAGTCTELTAASVTAEIQKPTDTTRTSTSTSSTSTDTTAKLRETTSEAHTKTAAPTSKASSTSHKSTAATNRCPAAATLTTATSTLTTTSSKQTPEAPRCTASHTTAASKSAAVTKGLKDKQEMISKITSESNKAAVLSHTGASLQHAASDRNASKSKEPGTASKTPTVTSAVHKTSAVSENTKGSPQTRSSEKSKASPHIHHKSNTPASASPSPSNHKASAREAANGEMRPEKNAHIGVNQLIKITCEKRQQVYCQLCSVKLKNSGHISSYSHRYNYVKYKFPDWSAAENKDGSELLQLVTRLAEEEKKAGCTHQEVGLSHEDYKLLSSLPDKTAILRLKSIMQKQREPQVSSSTTAEDEPKSLRPQASSASTDMQQREVAKLSSSSKSVRRRRELQKRPVQISTMESNSTEDRPLASGQADGDLSLTGEGTERDKLNPEPVTSASAHKSFIRGKRKSGSELKYKGKKSCSPGNGSETTDAPASSLRERLEGLEWRDGEEGDEHPGILLGGTLATSPCPSATASTDEQSPRGQGQEELQAMTVSEHSMGPSQPTVSQVLPNTSEGGRPEEHSNLSVYLMVKGMDTQAVIGLGSVWECRGISVDTIFLCESCRLKIRVSKICEHVVSAKHQFNYVWRHYRHFLHFWPDLDLSDEVKLNLLKEIAQMLSDRERSIGIDAQVLLLNKEVFDPIDMAPFSEALEIVQNIRRAQTGGAVSPHRSSRSSESLCSTSVGVRFNPPAHLASFT
ncbi:uncharacterized protein LOC142989701 [Genypterus blacodes]|uniref:uncharacterized protein LOC142989701 n=1 Tax=Genypterus blacodes TaxID=154954 RepID=UPI003F776380